MHHVLRGHLSLSVLSTRIRLIVFFLKPLEIIRCNGYFMSLVERFLSMYVVVKRKCRYEYDRSDTNQSTVSNEHTIVPSRNLSRRELCSRLLARLRCMYLFYSMTLTCLTRLWQFKPRETKLAAIPASKLCLPFPLSPHFPLFFPRAV